LSKVEIYTWSYCPFCIKAKELLEEKGIPYREVSIDGNEDKKKELHGRTGQNTVPFIFIGDRFIGGYTQLKELDDRGELEGLIR